MNLMNYVLLCDYNALNVYDHGLKLNLLHVRDVCASVSRTSLLKTIRRTGKRRIVRDLACQLAVRPNRRVRGKRHPEVVEQRRSRRVMLRRR